MDALLLPQAADKPRTVYGRRVVIGLRLRMFRLGSGWGARATRGKSLYVENDKPCGVGSKHNFRQRVAGDPGLARHVAFEGHEPSDRSFYDV